MRALLLHKSLDTLVANQCAGGILVLIDSSAFASEVVSQSTDSVLTQLVSMLPCLVCTDRFLVGNQ